MSKRSIHERRTTAEDRRHQRSGQRNKIDVPVVLVADDIEDNREMYAMVLRDLGFVVELAADGEEAIAVAATTVPDVIVMDLAMPVLDGWEATRRIRARSDLASVYIIAVSAFPDEESRRRAAEAGCDDFLVKPCLPATLADRIHAGVAAGDERRIAGAAAARRR